MCQLAKNQRKKLLVESRTAAEQVIQEALRQLEEPTLISCAGSAGTLLRLTGAKSLQVDATYCIKSHVTLHSGALRLAAYQNRLGCLGPRQDQFNQKLLGKGPGP